MKKQLFTFLFVALGWAMLPLPGDAVSSNLVVSEVQTQSSNSATQEFVELYNDAAVPVDVTGWKVEYTTATGSTTTAMATLSGVVPAHSFVLLSRTGYLSMADYFFSVGLAEAGGHVRLIDTSKQVIDLVGWGTAVAPETGAVVPAAKGLSLRRETDATQLLKITTTMPPILPPWLLTRAWVRAKCRLNPIHSLSPHQYPRQSQSLTRCLNLGQRPSQKFRLQNSRPWNQLQLQIPSQRLIPCPNSLQRPRCLQRRRNNLPSPITRIIVNGTITLAGS